MPKMRQAAKAENQPVDTVEMVGIDPMESVSLEEPVFPGGPTQTMIDEWRNQLKKKGFATDLYVLDISGEKCPFIYRQLNRPEYNEIIAETREKPDDAYRKAVINKCVLWPLGFTKKIEDDKGLAGTPVTLFESVMDASGFIVRKTWALQ